MRVAEKTFHPFKPNGLAYPYQLDQSISVLRLLGTINHFFYNSLLAYSN